jgi:hypothetical protein
MNKVSKILAQESHTSIDYIKRVQNKKIKENKIN